MTPNKLQELLDLKEEIEKLKEEIERKDILISDLKYELHKENPDNNRMDQEERLIKIRLRKKKEIEDWKQHYKSEIATLKDTIARLQITIGEQQDIISELENTIDGEEKQPKMNLIIIN
jgi:chromosome segregation ATPase